MTTLALIPTDLRRTRLGLPARLDDRLAGRSVLEHAVRRAAQVPGVDGVVLVHPDDQDPRPQVGSAAADKPVLTFPVPAERFTDAHQEARVAARKWSLTAWRGGIGGATCYDELLPAAPLLAALDANGGSSAVLLGCDWCLLDPAITGRVLAIHLANPQAMAMTFCQAPPGLAGVAIGRQLLADFAEHPDGSIGRALAYVPTRPQADPIGRDVCLQIDPAVRACTHRFVYDTPRSAALVRYVFDRGGALSAEAVAALLAHDPPSAFELPQQVTIELTPRRAVSGPVVPLAGVDVQRREIDTDIVGAALAELGTAQDACVTLGGLGDAVLHPQWRRIVDAARDAGVLGVAVETDLLVDEPVLRELLDAPVDAVVVRVNADTAAMYDRVMLGRRPAEGEGPFAKVVFNLQWLLRERARRAVEHRQPALPWIVPSFVKTSDTLADLETFFDRWTHWAGAALVVPFTPGRRHSPAAVAGAAGERGDRSAPLPASPLREGQDAGTASSMAGDVRERLFPLQMAPPKRGACRQLPRRMAVLSDGRVALCDQDWLGDGAVADLRSDSLRDAWMKLQQTHAAQHAGRWNESPLCDGCAEWHRV